MTKDRLKKFWGRFLNWLFEVHRPAHRSGWPYPESEIAQDFLRGAFEFPDLGRSCAELGHESPYRMTRFSLDVESPRKTFMDVRTDLDRLSGARPGSLITVAPNPRCEYCGGMPGAKERCGNCGAPNASR